MEGWILVVVGGNLLLVGMGSNVPFFFVVEQQKPLTPRTSIASFFYLHKLVGPLIIDTLGGSVDRFGWNFLVLGLAWPN